MQSLMPGEVDVPEPTPEEKEAELRIWCAVRRDLAMPAGKLANQAGHAYASVLWRAPREVGVAYMATAGQAKIAVGVKSEAELLKMYGLCKEAGLPTVIVRDQARTIFSEKVYTTMAVGPCLRGDLPKAFRKLHLLQSYCPSDCRGGSLEPEATHKCRS